jgi:gamma-glutamyltranspeptidase / glutathione hydrolase
MPARVPRPPRRLPAPRAMIVAPQPEAVEAGADVLRAGGSAIDAVLACAFVQGVVDPLMCGLGGLGVLHVWDPRDGRCTVLDGLSTCPAAATPDLWADAFRGECADGYGYVVDGYRNELGHQAVTTPGIGRLLDQAHAAWGRLPWADLLAPARAVAERGFLMRPHVAAMFALSERAVGRTDYGDKLRFTADGRRLYLRDDGTPKRAGDTVRNPELAASLATVAADGAEALYTGRLAEQVDAEMRRAGGLLCAADLAGYAVERREPLRVRYRGWDVATPPPPAGGIMVAQMLRLLERFDLVAMGHNSPEYVRVVAEAMKIAGRDKDAHIGDPRWQPPPLDQLLSDSYADRCAAAIRAGQKASLARVPEPAGTTTVSCVDADGLVASMTHTLGLPSGVIVPGTGFMLNGAMNWYDPRPGRAGSIAGGKRRFSSMCPSMVLQDGRPVATLGAPGGAWITPAILQAVLNLLDWGMGVQEAVMAPRFSATSDAIDLSNRIPFRTEQRLQDMGYETRRSPLSYAFAAVHGITLFDGVLEGGADPQRDGYAAAVA